MLHKKLSLSVLILVNLFSFTVKAEQKEILMVISGHASQSKDNKTENSHAGYEFDEFAKAYLVFKENNIKVAVASPQGGKVNASEFDANRHFNKTVLADAHAMKILEQSLSFTEVNSSNYQGVFVIGGNGAMYDLPDNIKLQKIIADIYENKGSVAAVCHGPAALVNVTLSDGSYLVTDRKVNSFTNNEENSVNKDDSVKFSFKLETKLRQRGGKFESSPLLMAHTVVDNRLITGQNQHSTGVTATEFLRSLGVNNVKKPDFKDEDSMVIVRRILSGDNSAIVEFHQNTAKYLPDLIAMYANGYARAAQNNSDIEKAVILMEMAMQHWQHPRLSLSLAQNLLKLGRLSQAKIIVTEVIKKKPEFIPAQKLLIKIEKSALMQSELG